MENSPQFKSISFFYEYIPMPVKGTLNGQSELLPRQSEINPMAPEMMTDGDELSAGLDSNIKPTSGRAGGKLGLRR